MGPTYVSSLTTIPARVRATSGLLFGLIDTMGAVDSGAITPLLRTSGSSCCPWAQVNHYTSPDSGKPA